MRLSVAMATYNGARYISEQLNSIAQQEHLPFEIVVCDDGSSDETVKIVEEFSRRAPFPVSIYINPKNLGFSDNFFKAASLCKGEWIAFCDQDDVWLPNRLHDAAVAINSEGEVHLILQNAILCQSDLGHNGRLFPNSIRPGLYRPGSQYAFWVWLGCLQTFRASVLREFTFVDRPRNYYQGHSVMSHDKWTCMIANATGGFIVLSKAAAYYRRHANAVTGSYAQKSVAERVSKSLHVGSEHYAFLAGTAEETAAYLRNMRPHHDEAVDRDLEQAAKEFDTVASIQASRARLYSGRSRADRLREYVHMAGKGGYLGPRMHALGWKSACKDALAILRSPGSADEGEV